MAIQAVHCYILPGVFWKVWAQVVSGMNVAGVPEFPHPDNLLSIVGYTRKYKAGGVEVHKDSGAGMISNFSNEKV